MYMDCMYYLQKEKENWIIIAYQNIEVPVCSLPLV